ncbi:phosphotransferase [Streptomyces otsuchiensis]|uniref:phosphotransferase n=2 Tax=Streptomyces TaxID=1883 RepID=UPI001D1324F2|nr:phosphotransferase [Streptomyces otsuchiensis]
MSPTNAPPAARTLSILTRRYGAGEPLSCEPLDRGLLNRGYRLSTTRGSYFLKHHLDGDPQTVLPLAARHRATEALAARGLPVVAPLADRAGRTVASLDGRSYALHPWVDGHHRDGGELSVPQSHRLGDLLGRVHAQLEHVIGADRDVDALPGTISAGAFAPARTGAAGSASTAGAAPGTALGTALGTASAAWPADRGRARRPADGPVPAPRAPHGPAPSSCRAGAAGQRLLPSSPVAATETARTEDTLCLIDQLLARIRRTSRRSCFDELAEHRLRERRRMLYDHGHRRPDRARIPASGWVHGDFHPLNLIYRSASPVEPLAIIDWDRLGVRPRAEEAVRAAVIFFLRADGGLDLPKVRAYARAYRQSTGAGADELDAATRRVWWERLNDFWMLRWHYELRDHRADPQFAASSALVVWWTRHAVAVRDAFSD